MSILVRGCALQLSVELVTLRLLKILLEYHMLGYPANLLQGLVHSLQAQLPVQITCPMARLWLKHWSQ